jgi:aspartate aminotransferase
VTILQAPPTARPVPKSATYEIARRVAALRAAGETILDLATGEPSFATPTRIVEAAEQALRDGYTRYTPSAGLPEARGAAAEALSRDHGVDVPSSRVYVVPSAKYGVYASLAAILEPGDEVVVVGPHWVSYEPMITLLSATVRRVLPDAATGYRFDSTELLAAMSDRTRAIVLNTPGNPTGRVLDEGEITAVAQACRRSRCWVVSDEIYAQIRFDGVQHRAPAAHQELADRTFTIGGLSKSHAMPGWRIGYIAAPESAQEALDGFIQNSVGCAPAFIQRASIVALSDSGVQDEIGAMVHEYGRRRDELCSALDTVPGFQPSVPEGALYVWADVSATGLSGTKVAESLLDVAGIAVVPGEAFGPEYADHIRLTYAPSAAVVSAACRALAVWTPR